MGAGLNINSTRLSSMCLVSMKLKFVADADHDIARNSNFPQRLTTSAVNVSHVTRIHHHVLWNSQQLLN